MRRHTAGRAGAARRVSYLCPLRFVRTIHRLSAGTIGGNELTYLLVHDRSQTSKLLMHALRRD